MKKIIPITLLSFAAACTSQAVDIWVENFEGAALGATSGNNTTLAGTVVQTANAASSIVVDATTDAGAAAAFTKASGNFIRLSVLDNDFAAVRSSANPISFTAVDNADIFTLSFDIYIPTTLDVPVGAINPRLEASGAAGNGATFSDHATLAAGEHTLTYTGTVADFINGAGPADTARPFIFIEQKINAGDDGTTADFLYMDNISFTITAVPEPGTYALLAGLAALSFVAVRRRK